MFTISIFHSKYAFSRNGKTLKIELAMVFRQFSALHLDQQNFLLRPANSEWHPLVAIPGTRITENIYFTLMAGLTLFYIARLPGGQE